MKNKNVIKRGSTKLKVEFLQEDFIERFGRFSILEKNEYWNVFEGVDKEGKPWCFMVSMLRDTEAFRIIECYVEKKSIKERFKVFKYRWSYFVRNMDFIDLSFRISIFLTYIILIILFILLFQELNLI